MWSLIEWLAQHQILEISKNKNVQKEVLKLVTEWLSSIHWYNKQLYSKKWHKLALSDGPWSCFSQTIKQTRFRDKARCKREQIVLVNEWPLTERWNYWWVFPTVGRWIRYSNNSLVPVIRVNRHTTLTFRGLYTPLSCYHIIFTILHQRGLFRLIRLWSSTERCRSHAKSIRVELHNISMYRMDTTEAHKTLHHNKQFNNIKTTWIR